LQAYYVGCHLAANSSAGYHLRLVRVLAGLIGCWPAGSGAGRLVRVLAGRRVVAGDGCSM